MDLPSVAIVGRPNVGKSALFNRLCGRPSAIVDGLPGVTRDRLYERVDWRGRYFQIIDTGGLFFNRKTESLSAEYQIEIELQVDIALQQAALIIFVVDNKLGITPLDIEIAHKLRSFNKTVIIAANKSDNSDQDNDASEFYNLSLGEVVPISAKHGLNIGTLLDHLVELLPKKEQKAPDNEPDIRVSILGRPNVGKSSLFNKLIGEERSIISDIAGTTHDAIDTDVEHDGRVFRFVDTAGIRKKKKVDTRIEVMSIKKATLAIERSEVCLLLIDPQEGVTKQDQTIANLIANRGNSCLIVLNKLDLIAEDELENFEEHIFDRLHFIDYAPLLSISAKQGENIEAIYPLILRLYEEHSKKIPTPELNKWLQKAMKTKAPPSSGAKQAKMNYIAQISTNPPSFAIFVNDPRLIGNNYKRYLVNNFREHFQFIGSPIWLAFRRKAKALEKDHG